MEKNAKELMIELKENAKDNLRKTLIHRYLCSKWKKQEVCTDCFGGDLQEFLKKVGVDVEAKT